MADRLTLARALEGGGIGRDAAEHIAAEILDAIHENVATKSDLKATETALRADLQATETALRADLGVLRTDLQTTETGLRAELKGEAAALRAELRIEVAALSADLALVEHRLATRLGSMVVAATGILIAIHYIH